MKTLSIQLFVAYVFLIQSTTGQCPSKCFCLDGSVTCIGLKSIPTAFPEDTRYLTISEIDVEQIPAGIFDRLPVLESVEIYDGNVGKISSDAFRSLSTLEFITLRELSIGTVESYAFNNITDTGSVTLEESTIDLIQPYAFFDMFALDHIKVSSNAVKYIDSFAFSTIDELDFSFQNNHVNTMKPYAFSQFSNLYEFSMYLNTLGDIGCGSFETLLYQAEERSFYSNKFNCTCNIVWAANRPDLKRYLFSNTCQLPGTEERVSWGNVSIETLHCIDSECPSAEYFEMLIPNVRITSSTAETSTRTSSRTTLPHTPSNTDISNSQEERSSEPKVTPTKTSKNIPAETSSHKKSSTTFKSSSTLKRITKITRGSTIKPSTRTSDENLEDRKTATKLPTTKASKTKPTTRTSDGNMDDTKTTTKLSATKTSTSLPVDTITISRIDVNIDSENLVPVPSNPKIVISENTAEVNHVNNTNPKGGSHEPVSAVLKYDERNGAKVKSLCWFLVMTVFTFTVI